MLKEILKFLSIFVVVFSVFLFLFLVSINPRGIVVFIGHRIGMASSVSNSVNVESNKFNTLAMQLKIKENQLDAREKELNNTENDLIKITNVKYNHLFLTFSILLLLLFNLVLFNFYRDHKRISKLIEMEHDVKEEIEDVERIYRRKFS